MGIPTRFPRLVVALTGVVALAACSGSSSTASDDAESRPSTTHGAVTLPPPELTEIHIGLSGEYSANVMHAIMAQYLELPEKYGFTDVTFTNFSGGSQVVQAMLAGQVDASDNSSGPVVASLATGSPLKMAFVTRANLTDILYTGPDIKTADDLRGGSIAISSFGSQSHASALVALDTLGLTTDDVTIQQVGNDSARAAALQAGSVSGSMNDATQESELAGLGMNIMVRLAEEDTTGGVVRTSLTFDPQFIEDNPNTVLDLVAMYLEANLAWRNDPEAGAAALSEYAEIPVEQAQAELESALTEPWVPLDGSCDPAVMEFTKETLLPVNPTLESVDPTEACTNEFIDQLRDLGFMDEIGVPADAS